MGSRWLIRRFRTGPQSKPRGHVSSPRSPGSRRSAGVLPRRCGAERRIRARPSVNAHPDVVRARESAAYRLAWRNNRHRPSPPPPRAPDEPSAALEWSLDATPFPPSSSSTTPSGPARPFRLARVPRPGMTNTDVRLGTHPGDRTAQGPPYARSITSRTLSRTNPHAYTDADDNRAVGVATLAPRSLGRPLPSGPLRNGVAWSCGVDERRAAGTLPGAAEGWRIPDPVPSASGPQIAATAVERRGADAPGVAGTVPGVAGRLAGIACRIRDRGVARAGLRSGSVGTGGCRAAQGLRA